MILIGITNLSDFATLKLPKTINNNNEDIIVNIDLPYLGTFAQKMSTSPYVILISAFNILLSYYTSSFDISIRDTSS